MAELKCFKLCRDFSCPTSSHINWSLTKNGPPLRRANVGWHPLDDLQYVEGGNTWAAQGKLTENSKEKLSALWAIARGGKQPHHNSHILGDYTSSPTEQVIVDEYFLKAVNDLNPSLFDFTLHTNVWDSERDCPPWVGDFFLATLLPTLPSYDLELSEIVKRTDVPPKFKGAYAPAGARRAVRASSIAGAVVWRDEYTRDVLCTQAFAKLLKNLGVPEWQTIPVEVIDDRQ